MKCEHCKADYRINEITPKMDEEVFEKINRIKKELQSIKIPNGADYNYYVSRIGLDGMRLLSV